MFIMCDEMWNSVDIYGPEVEIERFKRLCIVPAPGYEWDDATLAIDLDRVEAGDGEAWNFRELGRADPRNYAFAFDTGTRFPVRSFERLAEMFPRLAFHCECIADDDRSMGYGWFNTPPGGEDFRDDYKVPRGYWKSRVHKRSPAKQKRHEAVIAALKRALQEAAERAWSGLRLQ